MRLPDLLVAARRVNRDPDIGEAEWIDYANEAMRAASKAVFLPDLEASASVVVPAGATEVALPADYQRHLWGARNSDGVPLRVLRDSAAMAALRRGDPDAVGTVLCVAAIGRTLQVWPAPETEEAILVSYFRLPHALEMVTGQVVFSAADNTLTATTGQLLFGRFRAGDVFVVSGSTSNDNAFTVVSAAAMACVVAETVTDETAVTVGILAGEVEGVPEELHREVVVAGMLARAFDTGEDAADGGKPNTDRYSVLSKDKALQELKRAINATGYRAPRINNETAEAVDLVC